MQTTQATRPKGVTPSAQSYLTAHSISTYLNVSINSMESYATEKASWWIPAIQQILPTATTSSYAYLGYYATNNFTNPPAGSCNIYMANNDDPTNPCFAPPTGFAEIWKCSGNGAPSYLGIYNPIAPQGYIAIGTVAVMDFNSPPQVAQYPGLMCVRQDLVQQVSLNTTSNFIWADHNSKAAQDVSVFQLPNSQICYAVSGYPTSIVTYDIAPPQA
ncbi:DUF946 domain-containing protein [Paraflavitalea soli]|uniref:DUF946 domain-containing protein n=1 Tax=Paraflavitalea soli TaxID=2315862 RepID=A0A3B7MK46_9BACT|nr:Vps62-related protein [Paraflavitalea soli]AXY73673.1 DUF946 domain-containing protein [Paraflavitalea soli]